MKKKFRTILIIAIVALLLIAANITEIAVVFDATTSNATKYGEEWLEVIGGDLEKTIDDSKLSTLEFALDVQPLINDREKCEDYIRKKKKQMIEASNSVCFNVYLCLNPLVLLYSSSYFFAISFLSFGTCLYTKKSLST